MNYTNLRLPFDSEPVSAERPRRVRVIGPRNRRNPDAINTTSSAGWSSGFSPFLLGPVRLYGGLVARNVENAWQFSKVYSGQTGADGNPSEGWRRWAEGGFRNPRAVRYPMGKGAKPLYSWWDGERLDYVTARKRIYVPLYAGAVVETDAFRKLAEMYRRGDEIVLWDYDGYDYLELGMTLDQVLNDPTRKMGHAFVLAMLLEDHPPVAGIHRPA